MRQCSHCENVFLPTAEYLADVAEAEKEGGQVMGDCCDECAYAFAALAG